ncbi:unnamed protein product [Bursaphelenchus xylophilus]|uniref:(pine wood nematode) hypothetical protein n=1 Tax=Bursaphelenchus xylophilus TaxID=6326 RepID=A0A811M428_BURXY|nr:unnamed protein product [Bursaphelenchus xylophilus]CAG9131258.1 unnamed protein product [Bursaphelenchus xylophilus]
MRLEVVRKACYVLLVLQSAYSNVYRRLFFCGFLIFIPTLSHALLTQYHARNYSHWALLALRGSEIFSNLVIPVILYCTSKLVRRKFLGIIRIGREKRKVISATGFVDLHSHRGETLS